jgi:hypothetical protein
MAAGFLDEVRTFYERSDLTRNIRRCARSDTGRWDIWQDVRFG